MKKVTIRYKTRELGYGSVEGTTSAYVTDEIDTWGKRTVLIEVGDRFVPWYLFDDEWEAINRV